MTAKKYMYKTPKSYLYYVSNYMKWGISMRANMWWIWD